MSKVVWIAAFCVADTREKCQEKLDEYIKEGSLNPHACVVDAFFAAPVLEQNVHDLCVVRKSSLTRAIAAAMEALP